MWLKKMFGKTALPPVSYQPNPNSSQFEFQEEQEVNPSPLIDSSPDLRYKKYQSLPKTEGIKFPLSMLHEKQVVFCQELNVFNAKREETLEWSHINLLVSDRQLIITPNIMQSYGKSSLNYFSISFSWVQKCDILPSKNKKQATKMRILLKDDRQLQLKSILGDKIVYINEIINKFSFPSGINKFYAFQFGQTNQKIEEQNKGWQIYKVKEQFIRQGLKTNDMENGMLLKYIDNTNGQFSHTYPEWIVVPSKMNDTQLRKCAAFRTKERLPSLTYMVEHETNKYSMLFRCSQNKVGILSSRSKEDELMMHYIGDLTGKQTKDHKNCKIYDARGYYAALGNMFAGKGFEKPEFYSNCQIQWLNIPNIHAVRESYNKMMSYNGQGNNYFQLCSESGWYDYLYLILSGSKSVARDLLSGINVVVHCSDGWDRTSQLCALGQLLIDPYFRTIEGFAVLVEKDWRHFGHKFRQRTGQYHSTEYHPHEKSQIFIQFLDCIYQIMNQFPLSFEYNERLLHFLAINVDSNVYGTFMTNNIQQAKALKIEQSTISIWSHVKENIENYKNPYYNKNIDEFWLDVSIQPKNVRIWKSFFLGQGGSNNIEYHLMRQNMQINQTLRTSYYQNGNTIEELKKQLEELQKSV